jgi:ribosomal protein S15P/S13E
MNLTQKSNILNKSIEINKKDLLMNKSLKRLSSKSLSFEKKKK